MKLSLDKMNRMVLPKGLCAKFGLKPGDELEATVEANSIRLRPVHQSSPFAKEDGILVCSSETPVSTSNIGAFIDGQHRREVTKAAAAVHLEG